MAGRPDDAEGVADGVTGDQIDGVEQGARAVQGGPQRSGADLRIAGTEVARALGNLILDGAHVAAAMDQGDLIRGGFPGRDGLQVEAGQRADGGVEALHALRVTRGRQVAGGGGVGCEGDHYFSRTRMEKLPDTIFGRERGWPSAAGGAGSYSATGRKSLCVLGSRAMVRAPAWVLTVSTTL